MLRPFGKSNCPRCETELVHEFEIADTWQLAADESGDQRWMCRNCGFSRPVVYEVEREGRRRVQSGLLSRAVEPLRRISRAE